MQLRVKDMGDIKPFTMHNFKLLFFFFSFFSSIAECFLSGAIGYLDSQNVLQELLLL